MLKKIGERLVEKELITPDQLELALKAQLIYGGHLGTCLVELGMLDEDSLGETLGEIYQVPYAPTQLFEGISERVVRSFPCRVVETHRAIPFRLSDKVLDVAMVDPRDLRALDELSFVSGCKISPWIAPEVRVFQAMERYYGIPRRLRHISIAQAMDTPTWMNTKTKGGADRSGPGGAAPSGAEHAMDLGGGMGSLESFEAYGYGRPWQEIAEELSENQEGSVEDQSDSPSRARSTTDPRAQSGEGGRDARTATVTSVMEPPPRAVIAPAGEPTTAPSARKAKGGKSKGSSSRKRTSSGNGGSSLSSSSPGDPNSTDGPPQGGPITLETASRLLCSAADRWQIANAVLGFASGRMARAVLLSANGDAVRVWDALGVSDAQRGKSSPEFSLASEGLFTMLLGNEVFRGQLPRDTSSLEFYNTLKIEVPQEILLVPVYYNDRLVAILYGDGGASGEIQGDTDQFMRLSRMVSGAIALVIMKKKIQDLARLETTQPTMAEV